ncbi:MAG: TlpA disulfide reductase family protein [Ignavibacteriaceae bacterium]
MKTLLSVIILILTATTYAQKPANDLLASDVIKAVNPSVHTLKEIRVMKSFDSTFTKTIIQYENKNGNTLGFKFDFNDYYKYLRKIILGNDELFLRQYAAIQIPKISYEGCPYFKKDVILEKKCLELLKPDALVWKLFSDDPLSPILFFGSTYTKLALKNIIWNKEKNKKYFDYVIKKAIEYSLKIYKESSYKIVKANALVNIIDVYSANTKYQKSDYYYKILKSNYSDLKSDNVNYALTKYNPEARLRVGKIIPPFSFKLIDSDKTITNDLLKGKYYLLQFWATWCSPCLAEMPEVRKVYAKLGKSNFTIVSISLDDTVSNLVKYWKKNGKMPRYNVRLNNGWNDKAVKYFGIASIPVIILVGPEGKILANIGNEAKSDWLQTINNYITLN